MPRESIKAKTDRCGKIVALLRKAYPDARCSLSHRDPFELLVATILSAQCTDVRVNMVTPDLFAKYSGAEEFAAAAQADVEELIRSTGFYRNKAKNIIAASKMIVSDYCGKVPDSMDELLKLPGVARKTANVVMSNAFGRHEGVVVDTHVGRISRLLKLTASDDPKKVEKDLVKLLPQKDWGDFSHLLIDHGRAICKARRPDCTNCCLAELCPSVGK